MFCQAIILVQLGFLMVRAFDGSMLKCLKILLATLKNVGRIIVQSAVLSNLEQAVRFL